MVIEFANLWERSNVQLTLTGSYIRDREDFPGFYRCVFEYLQIKAYARECVDIMLQKIEEHGRQ